VGPPTFLWRPTTCLRPSTRSGGYRAKDIPSLILRKNLFGLEIDDRAAQLAAFALLMKARADDHHLFHAEPGVEPNILALQETKGLDAQSITALLNEPVLTQELSQTGELFVRDDELFTKKSMAVAGDLAQEDIASLIDMHARVVTLSLPSSAGRRCEDVLAETRAAARRPT
jgi:hypothetical protein